MKYKHVWLLTSSMLFGNKLSESDQLLWKSLQKNKIKSELINPYDIGLIVKKDGISFIKNGQNINTPELVIVRKKRGAEEHVHALAKALEKEGVAFFENVSAGGVGKVVTTIKRQGVVDIVPTLVASGNSVTTELAESLCEYPLIIKPEKGFGGRKVSRVNNRSELQSVLRNSDEKMMVQKYIEISDEYRVMVIDERSLGVAKKCSDGLAKNAAQGGVFEKVHDNDVELLAIEAAKLQAGRVYGVDIVKDLNGNLFVIECNRAPEFAAFNRALNLQVEDMIINTALN